MAVDLLALGGKGTFLANLGQLPVCVHGRDTLVHSSAFLCIVGDLAILIRLEPGCLTGAHGIVDHVAAL